MFYTQEEINAAKGCLGIYSEVERLGLSSEKKVILTIINI
jgi:hypothetical protein